MSKPVGRSLPITPIPPRVVTDLMHFSRQVPAVRPNGRMDLSPLIAASAAASPRPRWTVLFTKGIWNARAGLPRTRRAYLKCPRPRLYEHPHSIAAAVDVNRQVNGEDVVLFCLIRSPESSLNCRDGRDGAGTPGRSPR